MRSGLEGRDALVDEELGEEEDLVHQEDEGDEKEADEEGRDDLAQDVPVESGHRAGQKRRGQTYFYSFPNLGRNVKLGLTP